jgi:hypothetical protein
MEGIAILLCSTESEKEYMDVWNVGLKMKGP